MTHDTCHLIWQSHLASVPSLGSALWHCQRAPSFAVHIGALRLGNRDQVEVQGQGQQSRRQRCQMLLDAARHVPSLRAEGEMISLREMPR